MSKSISQGLPLPLERRMIHCSVRRAVFDLTGALICLSHLQQTFVGPMGIAVSLATRQFLPKCSFLHFAGAIMAVTCAGNNVLTYKVPRTFSQMIISSPQFISGSAWTITSGASNSGGTTFHGLTTGGTTTGGASVASGTLSSTVTYSNTTNSGGAGGGNPPGGWH